jgi:RNA-directed DNA polymerase
MSIECFKANAERYLAALGQVLRESSFEPDPVRRVHIPKGKGKTRPLGIATVKDRIVQTAPKLVLEPIFEKEFLPVSFGFRPGRSCKDALRIVEEAMQDGYTWVVDADLQSYIDTIPKTALLRLVMEKVSDGKVLELIKRFLDQEVVEGMKRWTPVAGTPEGSVISPLLPNLCLHGLDVLLSEVGCKYVRSADGFVALCRTQQEAEAVLGQIQAWVVQHGLTLHPDKTCVGNCMEKGQGFEFLGYRLEAGRRWVRPKSQKALRVRIRLKTGRTRSGSLATIITELNPILRKREKRPGFGRTARDHRPWPNAFFV